MARDMRAETAALAHQNSNEITLEPCKPNYRFNRITAAAHARSAGRSARHLLHLGQFALRGRHGVSQEHACRGRVWAECGEQGRSVGSRGGVWGAGAECGVQGQPQHRAAAHLHTPSSTGQTARQPRCSAHVTTRRSVVELRAAAEGLWCVKGAHTYSRRWSAETQRRSCTASRRTARSCGLV